MNTRTDLPVVVIGAGPSGLAAAANLHQRGIPAVVLEAGDTAGAAVREWAHIRLFSPWSELVDTEAAKVLAGTGWDAPNPKRYPTGGDWATAYLQPLADALGTVKYGHMVTGVAKRGRDLVVDSGRDDEAFTVHVATGDGEQRIDARAVIDASGTWSSPNPLGGDGLPAAGEKTHADRIAYRVPDLDDPTSTTRYAGKHVAIAGTGASGKTALIAFTKLAEEYPGTRISWLVRRPTVGSAFGGGENDELSERGALGDHARAAVTDGPTRTITGFRTSAVEVDGDQRLRLTSFDGQMLDEVDEVVVLTGFRPDLGFLSEVRLDLDPILQAPRDLAPLIDPNVHSCGTVYPHGAKELTQPETGFYLVGMKSYGRATSFLALTGFEQVRSVVAEIVGDHEAAARVDLVLPESGVCGGAGNFDEPEATDGGCCGPAEQATVNLIGIGSRPSS
jgi:cation diffusion facilitator CzcD-associated flavoprotein CzcO